MSRGERVPHSCAPNCAPLGGHAASGSRVDRLWRSGHGVSAPVLLLIPVDAHDAEVRADAVAGADIAVAGTAAVAAGASAARGASCLLRAPGSR